MKIFFGLKKIEKRYNCKTYYFSIESVFTSEMSQIINALEQDYPSPNQKAIDFLRQRDKESPISNWRQLTEALAVFFRDNDPNMNVCKSSSWAVCQEFLGNVRDDLLWYTRARGGLWSYSFDLDRDPQYESTTVREILEDFRKRFPE